MPFCLLLTFLIAFCRNSKTESVKTSWKQEVMCGARGDQQEYDILYILIPVFIPSGGTAEGTRFRLRGKVVAESCLKLQYQAFESWPEGSLGDTPLGEIPISKLCTNSFLTWGAPRCKPSGCPVRWRGSGTFLQTDLLCTPHSSPSQQPCVGLTTLSPDILTHMQ